MTSPSVTIGASGGGVGSMSNGYATAHNNSGGVGHSHITYHSISTFSSPSSPTNAGAEWKVQVDTPNARSPTSKLRAEQQQDSSNANATAAAATSASHASTSAAHVAAAASSSLLYYSDGISPVSATSSTHSPHQHHQHHNHQHNHHHHQHHQHQFPSHPSSPAASTVPNTTAGTSITSIAAPTGTSGVTSLSSVPSPSSTPAPLFMTTPPYSTPTSATASTTSTPASTQRSVLSQNSQQHHNNTQQHQHVPTAQSIQRATDLLHSHYTGFPFTLHYLSADTSSLTRTRVLMNFTHSSNSFIIKTIAPALRPRLQHTCLTEPHTIHATTSTAAFSSASWNALQDENHTAAASSDYPSTTADPHSSDPDSDSSLMDPYSQSGDACIWEGRITLDGLTDVFLLMQSGLFANEALLQATLDPSCCVTLVCDDTPENQSEYWDFEATSPNEFVDWLGAFNLLLKHTDQEVYVESSFPHSPHAHSINQNTQLSNQNLSVSVSPSNRTSSMTANSTTTTHTTPVSPPTELKSIR